MSQPQRILPETSESDVDQVLRVLRQSGPMPLRELQDHPEFDGWQAGRVNDAVVVAWSRDRISIDPRDLLVVL